MAHFFISILSLSACFLTGVLGEGYICPYSEVGYDGGENRLLYDYYDLVDGGAYYTRKGETGWQSPEEYCRQKGDSSIHSDAGEWKCNDSKGICNWNGVSCDTVPGREAECLVLCRAILDGRGPGCLGNCPGGRQSNEIYALCDGSSGKTTGEEDDTPTETVDDTDAGSNDGNSGSTGGSKCTCKSRKRKRSFVSFV